VLEFAATAPLLQAVGMSDAASEPVNLRTIAHELGRSADAVEQEIELLEATGLILLAPEAGLPARLLRAGRQYLASKGNVSSDALGFLPHTIDDLVARRALLDAGTILVDEFRAALLNGDGVGHARELVPPAFAEAVTDGIALDLFAAAVALMARLSHEQPAGCVAEEIVAVALINEAAAWIELERDAGPLDDEGAEEATEMLRGLFELFEDDDVLKLFDMREPADAAVQGHSKRNRQLGVVDQRVQAWFTPFGGIARTGYLSDTDGTE
jgi:hypothetical protein